MSRQWFVYALKDPRTDAIRYVGWAFDAKRRRQAHLDRAKYNITHKDHWILKLASEGVKPSLEILESGAGDGATRAECEWIFRLRALGHDLTNSSDGGSSGFAGGVHTPEARAKIAAAGRGRVMSPERIAKSVATRKANPKWRTHIKALAELNRGKERSPQTKAKISKAGKGRKRSPEAAVKISAALRGRKLTPEKIASLSASRDNAETRAKISAGNKGKKLSPETKVKIGEARRAAWKRDGGRARRKDATEVD